MSEDGASSSPGVLDLHGAASCSGEMAHDREAEPQPAMLLSFFDRLLAERSDVRQEFWRCRAGIAYANPSPLPRIVEFDKTTPPGRGELTAFTRRFRGLSRCRSR